MIIQDYNDSLKKDKSRAPLFDPVLLVVYLLLITFGMLAAYSATIAEAHETGDVFVFLRANSVHIVISICAMFIVSMIPVHLWQNLSPILLIGGILLLALVFVPGLGVKINGSIRWIQLGGWNFQPSEFAEIGFLLFAADYLTNRRSYMNRFFADVVPIIGIYLVFAVLLLLEPDFGSAAVLGGVLFGMLYLSYLRWTHIITLAGAGIACLVALIMFEEYRFARLVSFLDPWQDPYGSGFQLVQSLIAFGRGEIFGVGIGNSVLKLFYLPYAGSDFLLAIIAEELGFVGITAAISLFVILIWRIFFVARLAEFAGERYAVTVAHAIAMLIAVSAIINIGVNMGVLPTKGLTLPFMSQGGTSLIAFSSCLGIVFSIERSCRQKLEK